MKTKFKATWVKKGQNAGFLRLISSKITSAKEKKKKRRKKRKEKKKERRGRKEKKKSKGCDGYCLTEEVFLALTFSKIRLDIQSCYHHHHHHHHHHHYHHHYYQLLIIVIGIITWLFTHQYQDGRHFLYHSFHCKPYLRPGNQHRHHHQHHHCMSLITFDKLNRRPNCFTDTSKFQFDRESGRRRTKGWMCYLYIVIFYWLFIGTCIYYNLWRCALKSF